MQLISNKQSRLFRKVAWAFLFFQIIFTHSALADSGNKQLTVEIPNSTWWYQVSNNQTDKVPSLKSITSAVDLKTLARVREHMKKMDYIDFTIAIVKSDTINAYANLHDGMHLIIFTSGFIHKFGNDSNVLANTIGHELAHHYFGHSNHENESNTYAANSVAQPMNNIGTSPVSLETLDVYEGRRNQERAADLLGMYWATHAGYSAIGAYKLAQGLQELQGGQNYIPTHPSNAERMETAQMYTEYCAHSECNAVRRSDIGIHTEKNLLRAKRVTQLVQISNENNAEEFEIF